MSHIDLEKMLARIKATQWSLSDVDWDAPGAELIRPEQWPKLKAFMADVMWVEHVGARGFAAWPCARGGSSPVQPATASRALAQALEIGVLMLLTLVRLADARAAVCLHRIRMQRRVALGV